MSSNTRRDFGGIRRLPSGRWQVRYIDTAARRRTAPHTFATKTDARVWLTQTRADLLRGEWRDPRLGEETFGEIARRWFATTTHLKPRTRQGYESILRVHLLPRFGDRPVRSIDTPEVRSFLADLDAAGAAPATTRYIRAVLRLILASAVESRAIASNPCVGVKVARSKRIEPEFLSAAEVEDLADAITDPPIRRGGGEHRRASYPEYGLLVRFAAYTGLRWGELAALRVGRLDLMRARVEVVEAQTEVSGLLVYGSPKNHQVRSVPVPRFLVDDLARLTAGKEAETFVFRSPTGASLRHSNFYEPHFRAALLRAGLPRRTRFHDLRHTCAALLIERGAHPLSVMRWLGHSSITVSMNVYGHLFAALEEKLADGLDAVGRGARESRLDSGRLRAPSVPYRSAAVGQ